MKTITKLNFRGIEIPLSFEIDITEEELEELKYDSDTLCILVLLKEIEKLKEYVDKDFVKKNTIDYDPNFIID